MSLKQNKKKYGKNFYETDKKYYESLEIKEKNRYWFKDYLEKIFEYSNPKSKILECGCGTGISTMLILENRKNTFGVDFSKKYISRAKKRGRKFAVMDTTNLNFKTESFDLVCSADMIEHIPNIEKALDEMTRVLKNKGFLIIQAPNLTSNIVSYNYRKTPKNIFRKIGLVVKEIFVSGLRTIENSELDVIGGDKDAYNLLSPVWLKRELKRRGYKIRYINTYSVFFEINKLYKAILYCISRIPVVKNMGGRIILVAQKHD